MDARCQISAARPRSSRRSLALTGCAELAGKPKLAPPVRINEDPYPSTYVRYPGVPTVIRHATVFDGDGRRINDGTVVFADGVIQAVGGPELAEPRRRASRSTAPASG